MTLLESLVKNLLAIYYHIFARVDYTDDKKRQPRPIAPSSEDKAATGSSLSMNAEMDMLSLDEHRIASVLKRERYYRDIRNWQNLRNCYHPSPSKTRIEVGAFKGNIDGFLNLSMMTSPSDLAILHPINTVHVEIRGKRAVAVSIDTTLNRFEHKGRWYDLTSWTRSVSRLSNEEAGWRLCYWETIYNRDMLVPVDGSDALPDWGDLSSLRRPYCYLAWFISQKGVKMSQGLPGDDDPQSVSEVFKRSQAWLEEEVEVS